MAEARAAREAPTGRRARAAGASAATATTATTSGRAAPQDRRARILEAATLRFAEAGFAATTVRQIADDVAILSGSLYHHFATKEDMLAEVVRDTVLFMEAEALRIAALPEDAETRLVTLIYLNLKEMTRNRPVHAILFNERKLFRRNPDFAFVVAAKKGAYQAWDRIIADGVEAGLFDPAVDRFLTISTLVRMLNSGADWFRDEDSTVQDKIGSYGLAGVADFYARLLLRSLRRADRTGAPIPGPLRMARKGGE